MKVKDIVTESMTFNASTIVTNSKGREVITSVGSKQDVDCFYCEGNGKDIYSHGEDCPNCDGTGRIEDWVSDGPEMNVANSNGYEIQRMLGLEPDEYGQIENKDLPTIMQKLMRLKNGDTAAHTKDGSTEQGEMRKRNNDDGTTSIGRGPTMMDMGRSQSQINSYIDRLMSIVKYAQNNGYDVSWG